MVNKIQTYIEENFDVTGVAAGIIRNVLDWAFEHLEGEERSDMIREIVDIGMEDSEWDNLLQSPKHRNPTRKKKPHQKSHT